MDEPSQPSDPDPMALLEGRDFTWENGLMVLSSQYLLRRGYCCESGCRNCPYGFKTKNDLSLGDETRE